MKGARFAMVLVMAAVLLAGCSLPVQAPIPLPGQDSGNDSGDGFRLPADLGDLANMWQDLGLPDLSDLADLPGVDSLPIVESVPGGIVLRGPVERRVVAGNYVPGTDLYLTRTGSNGAEFEILSMRSVRTVGDSLDFDGAWPGLQGVEYSARLRIYHVGEAQVRAAGVHQLKITGIAPQKTNLALVGQGVKFPYTARVAVGETIPGTTLGYAGENEFGAELTGLDADEYPYRKVGDSVRWMGNLRPDIAAEFHLRILTYDSQHAQIGGTVTVAAPSDRGE